MPRPLGSALARRRWANFRANRRAWWSAWIFGVLFVLCLFAELVANDRPLLVSYQGGWYAPVFRFYPETEFGGEFESEAEYPSPEVQCLIHTGGLPACLDDPRDVQARAAATGEVDGRPVERGWMLWPPVPYSFNTINYDVPTAPAPPDANHWLGTDDQTRDVLARIIFRFRGRREPFRRAGSLIGRYRYGAMPKSPGPRRPWSIRELKPAPAAIVTGITPFAGVEPAINPSETTPRDRGGRRTRPRRSRW